MVMMMLMQLYVVWHADDQDCLSRQHAAVTPAVFDRQNEARLPVHAHSRPWPTTEADDWTYTALLCQKLRWTKLSPVAFR